MANPRLGSVKLDLQTENSDLKLISFSSNLKKNEEKYFFNKSNTLPLIKERLSKLSRFPLNGEKVEKNLNSSIATFYLPVEDKFNSKKSKDRNSLSQDECFVNYNIKHKSCVIFFSYRLRRNLSTSKDVNNLETKNIKESISKNRKELKNGNRETFKFLPNEINYSKFNESLVQVNTPSYSSSQQNITNKLLINETQVVNACECNLKSRKKSFSFLKTYKLKSFFTTKKDIKHYTKKNNIDHNFNQMKEDCNNKNDNLKCGIYRILPFSRNFFLGHNVKCSFNNQKIKNFFKFKSKQIQSHVNPKGDLKNKRNNKENSSNVNSGIKTSSISQHPDSIFFSNQRQDFSSKTSLTEDLSIKVIRKNSNCYFPKLSKNNKTNSEGLNVMNSIGTSSSINHHGDNCDKNNHLNFVNFCETTPLPKSFESSTNLKSLIKIQISKNSSSSNTSLFLPQNFSSAAPVISHCQHSNSINSIQNKTLNNSNIDKCFKSKIKINSLLENNMSAIPSFSSCVRDDASAFPVKDESQTTSNINFYLSKSVNFCDDKFPVQGNRVNRQLFSKSEEKLEKMSKYVGRDNQTHLPQVHALSKAENTFEKDIFIESFNELKNKGWYWGPLTWKEACDQLKDKPLGSFLVRDSSDERYILSLSFKSEDSVHHTRIEHFRGQFSFNSQPRSHGAATIVEFIEKAIENSIDGSFSYFLKPKGQGIPPTMVKLTNPISRFMKVHSLQHLCRFVLLTHTRRDMIDQLPLPFLVKQYLSCNQYYVEDLNY